MVGERKIAGGFGLPAPMVVLAVLRHFGVEGGMTAVATVLAFASGVVAVTYGNYKTVPGWPKVRHFWPEIILGHILAGGWLVALTDRFRATGPYRPGDLLRGSVIQHVEHYQDLHPNGFDDLRSSVSGRCQVFRTCWLQTCVAWAERSLSFGFGCLLGLSGVAGLAQAFLGFSAMGPLFFSILLLSSVTLVSAWHGHASRSPVRHQLSMGGVGASQALFSIGLWHYGVGFTSLPPLVGWVGGTAFGAAIVAWVIAAYLDPDGRERCCKFCARATACLGAALIALNTYERVHTQQLGLEAILSLWPLGVATAAFLAAVSPRSWNVGLRGSAVDPEPLVVDDRDPNDDGEGDAHQADDSTPSDVGPGEAS